MAQAEHERQPPPWRHQQLVDLEYFCHLDRDLPEEELHRRDREIFRQIPAQQQSANGAESEQLLRHWLARRLHAEFPRPEEKSPGTVFAEVLRLTRWLALAGGGLFGLLAGFSFFNYSGTTPINVFHFLLIFVVSQHALLAAVAIARALHRLFPDNSPPSLFTLLSRSLLRRLVRFWHRHWLRATDAGKRAAMEHALGVVNIHSNRYGGLFFWLLFGLNQLFAVGANLGLLLATLLKLATSDLAFGWQSTISLSAAALEQTVRFLALPWSWLLTATPTLSEIEGSRIILKDGIEHLASQDLIAWWPFLLLCLLVYGLFPRLLLLALSRLGERQRLLRLPSLPCQPLLRRLRTPLLRSQAPAEEASARHPASPSPATPGQGASPATGQPLVLLQADDLYPLYRQEQLTALLAAQHLLPREWHPFLRDYDADQELLGQLAERHWQPEEGLGMVVEGWMPPLTDFLSYIKRLRQALPADTTIHLALLGRPAEDGPSPLAAADWQIWQQKTGGLGDPFLHLLSLSP